MPNQNRDGNFDVRNLPVATEEESLDSRIFLAPLSGPRQDLFLSLSMESLLQLVAEDTVLSGSGAPDDDDADRERAQLYFRLTSQEVDTIYFSPLGSDRWVEFFDQQFLSGNLPPVDDTGDPMHAQVYFQLSSVEVMRMWFSPLGSDRWVQADFGQRPVIAGTTGLTFVPATRVITDVNGRTGGMSLTLDVTGVTQYAEGMGFRFRSGDRNRSEIVRLRLGTSLPYVEILNISGQRFGQNEFLPNFLHTIIYDGANWVALDTVDTPLTIIPETDLTFDDTADPNLITIANPDQIVFYGGIAQILFQMEGTNNNDVELSFVPGVSHDVLTSRNEQIPAGYLHAPMFVRAVYDSNRLSGAWITDVEGPRSLRGPLAGTLSIAHGSYSFFQRIGGWVVGTAPDITVEDFTGAGFTPMQTPVAGHYLTHLDYQANPFQLGWWIEISGPAIANPVTFLVLFGDTGGVRTISVGDVGLAMTYSDAIPVRGSTGPNFSFQTFSSVTIDDTNDFTINVYVIQN